MNPTPRFLPYGSPDALFFEPLTSSPGNGLNITGSDAGNVSYTEKGVQLGKNISLIKTTLTPREKSQLQAAGCMTLWVESSFLFPGYSGGSVASGNEYLFTAFYYDGSASNYLGVYKGNGSNVSTLRGSSVFSTPMHVESPGKNRYARVDLSWVGSTAILYIDYFPCARITIDLNQVDPFNRLYIGGPGFDSPQSHRMKNFQIAIIPVATPVHPKLSSLVSLGHSFALNGDYSGANQWILGSGGSAGEVKTNPTIHRMLLQLGINIGSGRINSYAVSGTSISQLSTQVTAAIVDHGVITSAMIQTGANDVLAGTVSPANNTDLQIEIDRLKAVGCELILLFDCASLSMDSNYSSSVYTDRVDALNATFQALDDTNSEVKRVRQFSMLGGHTNFNPDDFGANYHPSNQGYNKIGVLGAQAIIANLG